MKKQYGFVTPKIDDTHYVLGGFGSLPKVVIQPDGQWDAFLPVYEPQFGGGWDTDGCTVWGTQNAIETYIRKICGREDNYSERYTYILAGIRPPGGDPHKVAETIRGKGLIGQNELPMTTDFVSFTQPDPMTPQLLAKGQTWLDAFEFKHDWLYTKQPKQADRIALIKEALQYSPLAISVTAWHLDGDVYRDMGQPNCHWCVCFGWTDKGWKIFDSYDQTIKIYSFDSSIEYAKRYLLTIKNKEEQISLIKTLINKLLQLLGFELTHPNAKPTDEVVSTSVPNVAPEPPQPQPEPPKYDWDTPVLARHSVRVICDEEGLTVEQKDTLCATVGAESGWNPKAVRYNYGIRSGQRVVLSKDSGICQWNDYYHGKEITPDEALNNPEKAVRLMCAYWKRGQRNLWVSFSTGLYKKYL